MEGILKEGKWDKGNFVCLISVDGIGDLKFILTPEQLSDMKCGYSQRDIENAFRVCYAWINLCERGRNAEMLREHDISVQDFRKAKEILDDFKDKKVRFNLEFF